MLDKRELIHTLAFEEHKIRSQEQTTFRHALLWQGLLVAAIVGALAFFWPLLTRLYEVAEVNFVVYTDRKQLEAKRCWEYQSVAGIVGVLLMFFVDALQIWLTASVLLSWIIARNKYFFPIPNLPVNPAQFMGGPISTGPLSQYGINVGPMLVTWGLRFLHGRLEGWVGGVLIKAQKRQRAKQRANETTDEKRARREAKRKRKLQKQQAEQSMMSPLMEPTGVNNVVSTSTNQVEELDNVEDITPPTLEERRRAAANAADTRLQTQIPIDSNTALDELD